MKKLLLSLLSVVALGFGSASAETATLKMASGDLSGLTTSKPKTVTKNNVSWTFTMSGNGILQNFDSTKGQQFGSKNSPISSLVITSDFADYTVKSVTLNTSGASGTDAKVGVTVGGSTFLYNDVPSYALTTTATDVTFKGSASGELEIKFTLSARALYLNSITVEYEKGQGIVDPDKVAAPDITMEEQNGNYFVTMTCETEDAEIRYAMYGQEPTATSTLYTAPIQVWEPTEFKAIAVKGDKTSSVTSYKADVPFKLDSFTSLSDFMWYVEENPGGLKVIIDGPMTVAYQNGKNLYVKDGDGGYMCLYGENNTSYVNGDTFNHLEGTFVSYNGLPEITNYTMGVVSKGEPVVPYLHEELKEIGENMLNYYVMVEGVTISGINAKNFTIAKGENTLVGYNSFGIELKALENATITGIVTIYNGKLQLYPTEILDSYVPVPVFTPESGATIERGTYIKIKAEKGTVYYSLEGEDAEFAEYADDEVLANNGGEFNVWAYAQNGEFRSEIVKATYTVNNMKSRNLRFLDAEGNEVTEWAVTYYDEYVMPEFDGDFEEAEEFAYTSSNEKVAAIEDMMVVVKGCGETVITLSIPETANYAAAEASFTLTVNKANPGLRFLDDNFEELKEMTVMLGDEVYLPMLDGIVECADDEIVLTSSNEAVAKINDMMGFDVVGAGTAVITLSIGESANYAADEASFTLIVIDPNAPATGEAVIDFVNQDYGMTRLSGSTQQYNENKTYTTDFKEGKNVDIHVNEHTRLWSDGLRMYNGGEVTFSVPGATITGFEVYYKSGTGKNFAIYVDDSESAINGSSYTGRAKSFTVKYTPTSSNSPVVSLVINYEVIKAPEGAHKFDVMYEENGDKKYIVVSGVHAESELYCKITKKATAFTTYAVDHNGYTQVQPYSGDKHVIYVQPDDAAISLYTYHPASDTKSELYESDLAAVPTGVDDIVADDAAAEVEYYNLQGVRIENPAKGGLYIKKQGNTVSKVVVK